MELRSTQLNSVGAPAPQRTSAIQFVIDGGGSVPGTGAYGQISIPFACTLKGWVLTADQSGSAVIDVLRSTYAAFPTTASIAGSDKPTLATVRKTRILARYPDGVARRSSLAMNCKSISILWRLARA